MRFLQTTYDSIKWPGKPRATPKATEMIKDTPTATPMPANGKRQTPRGGQGRTTRVPDEGTKGEAVRSPIVTATEGRRDWWRSRGPIGKGAARDNGQNRGERKRG